jgi:neurotransmitter:Na+ symporter, NSS family
MNGQINLPPSNEAWSSRYGFILATIGSAIGIGSIWKFPYEVGANGGGAFVLVYALGLLLVVVPLMFAEFAIGRRGHSDSASSIAIVARDEHASRYWQLAGLLGAVTCFLILSFYSVIGGWTLAYALQTLWEGLPAAQAGAAQAQFDALLASPERMLAFHGAFMALVAVVVMRGVQRGLESASKILMPLLALLMCGLAIYSMIEGDTARTLRFLFVPDLAHLTTRAVLDALGLGFFSIGIGLGLMITYAGYSDAAINLKQVAIWSVLADSSISLVAGLAVFPMVFANGLDPAGGPGLMFVSLPLALARMPFANIVGVAFFALLFVAALSSAMATLEGIVAVLVHRKRWSRQRATLISASACFITGILTVLSFNRWANWFPLASIPMFATATMYGLVDYLTSNLLLPLGGLAVALFVGWATSAKLLQQELRSGKVGTRILRFLLRYIAPATIICAASAPIFAWKK